MRRPRVAILTCLTDFSPAFSPTGIILDQARALRRAGYDYELLCLKMFNPQDRAAVEAEGLRVSFRLANTKLHDYRPDEPPRPDSDGEPGFERQAEIIFAGDDSGEGYHTALAPFDVIITHDIMFLSWFLPHNKAIRRCVELWPEKRWLHWVHSGPWFPSNVVYPSTLRHQGCPNSLYVFLNHHQRQDLANMLGITVHDIAVVYNTKDIRDVYGFAPETCALIDTYRLLDHQILQVYAFSTPRWVSKGVRQLLRIFGAWKQMGLRAKLVLVNAHCGQEENRVEVRLIEEYARGCGLTVDEDVVLTSRFAHSRRRAADAEAYRHWNYSVPQRVVRELTLIANVFIFPSVSECCSLIQAENAIAGKFIVLNRDFPAMLEFSNNHVLHYQFTANDPDLNPVYYECVAQEVWSHLSVDATFQNTTHARTRLYNRDWIWKHQFEPLLYRGFSRFAREQEKAPPSGREVEAAEKAQDSGA